MSVTSNPVVILNRRRRSQVAVHHIRILQVTVHHVRTYQVTVHHTIRPRTLLVENERLINHAATVEINTKLVLALQKRKKYNKCLKYNHFACVCRSVGQSQKVSVNAHSVTTEASCDNNHDDSSSESDFFVETVDSVCTDTGHNQAFVIAKICPSGKDVKFKVDTGSQVNILLLKHYQALSLKDPLIKTQSQLFAHSGDALKVLGTVTPDCLHTYLHIKRFFFYIVDTDNPSLLGLKSSIDLNVIQLV